MKFINEYNDEIVIHYNNDHIITVLNLIRCNVINKDQVIGRELELLKVIEEAKAESLKIYINNYGLNKNTFEEQEHVYVNYIKNKFNIGE